MKDNIILICGDIEVGSTIVSRLNSLDFNDVVIVNEAEKIETERGIKMNIHVLIINDYMPTVYEDIYYNKRMRKGGKKNKKNWKY